MNKECPVLLYQTPFGHYVYDANHNEILSVNEELFKYISKYDTDENEEEEYSEETISDFNELRELGYLLPSFVQKIEHPYTSQIENILERKVDQITLQVTQNCNLRCSYCIYSADSNLGQRSHSNNCMSLETAKKALGFYKEHSIDSEIAAIGFYGGEPLLEFKLIQQVVDYAKEIFEGKEISFAITTNATLLTEEALDYLVENKFVITISIDGPKEIQDKNRKFANGMGSFDIVKKNIHRFYEKYPEILKNVMISMVINPDEDYREIVQLFEMQEFQDISLTYTIVEEDGRNLRLSKKYLEKYFYDLFLGYVEYFENQSEPQFPTKIVETDFEEIGGKVNKIEANLLSAITAPGGPCLPGKSRLLVNCFGELYPCERVNENACMKIGTIRTGFDFKQVEEILNVGRLTEEKCKTCWAFQLCNICAKRVDDCGKLSASKKMEACAESKESAYSRIRNTVLMYEHQQHVKRMRRIVSED